MNGRSDVPPNVRTQVGWWWETNTLLLNAPLGSERVGDSSESLILRLEVEGARGGDIHHTLLISLFR